MPTIFGHCCPSSRWPRSSVIPASNGTRRLGQQLARALEVLNRTQTVKEFSDAYKQARATVETTAKNEKATLGTVVELASDKKRLNTKPVKIVYSDIEKKAAKVFPKPTAKVKADGYRGYFEYINKIPAEEKKKYPYKAMNLGDSRELQLLINEKNSVLDIKDMLDAQSRRLAKLEDIFYYLEILKLAGLVEF